MWLINSFIFSQRSKRLWLSVIEAVALKFSASNGLLYKFQERHRIIDQRGQACRISAVGWYRECQVSLQHCGSIKQFFNKTILQFIISWLLNTLTHYSPILIFNDILCPSRIWVLNVKQPASPQCYSWLGTLYDIMVESPILSPRTSLKIKLRKRNTGMLRFCNIP